MSAMRPQKQNNSLASTGSTSYNKTKDTNSFGSYTGSSVGFNTSSNYLPGSASRKETFTPKPKVEPVVKTPSIGETYRAKTGNINAPLPRAKPQTQTLPMYKPEAPKLKLNLPNTLERDFAKGALGDEREREVYNFDILDQAAKKGYLKDTRTEADFFRTGFLGLEDKPKYAFTDKADDEVKYDLFNLLDYKTPQSRIDAFKEIQERSKFSRAREAYSKLHNDTLPKVEETTQQGFIKPAGELRNTSFDLKKQAISAPAKSPIETVKEFWEDLKETGNDIWVNTKETVGDFLNNPKDTAINLVNGASAWANEKGFFDDATNAFFKASDSLQNLPEMFNPTHRLHQSIADENYIANQKIDLSKYDADGGYINDQNPSGSQSGKIRYGFGTFRDNGCEIIAVNNALVSLGNRKDVRDIARDFETNGQFAFGYLGTSPFAIGDYFEKQGYQVETFAGDQKIYNLDIPDADTYILSFWNSDKITSMIHTVSMDKLPNGKYRMYNMGGTSIDVESLNQYLLEKKRVPLVLHCIKKGR